MTVRALCGGVWSGLLWHIVIVVQVKCVWGFCIESVPVEGCCMVLCVFLQGLWLCVCHFMYMVICVCEGCVWGIALCLWGIGISTGVDVCVILV